MSKYGDLEWIKFDGTKSLDLNIAVISRNGLWDTPERDYSVEEVPGRDGELLFDNARYKNVPLEFESFLLPESPQLTQKFKDLDELSRVVKDWLIGDNIVKYRKLESSKQPNYYRMAYLSNKLAVEDLYSQIGRAVLHFSCMPYLYNKLGDKAIEITTKNTNRVLRNPERCSAKPIIEIYGSGNCVLTINGKAFSLLSVATKLTLDCERMIVFENDNTTAYGKLTGIEFPVLDQIENTVMFSGTNITKVVIYPKWRRV